MLLKTDILTTGHRPRRLATDNFRSNEDFLPLWWTAPNLAKSVTPVLTRAGRDLATTSTSAPAVRPTTRCTSPNQEHMCRRDSVDIWAPSIEYIIERRSSLRTPGLGSVATACENIQVVLLRISSVRYESTYLGRLRSG